MRNLFQLLPLVITAVIACPLPGPTLPQPKDLVRSSILSTALKNLTATLDSAVAGDIDPGFQVNITSFSIVLNDAHNQLWEYHHTAETTTNGTHSVNASSQYRIGSVSKVFTDLLLLRLNLDLGDKITKYLPGLNEGNGTIEWDRVTLRDLGSHMSGVQANYGFLEDYVAEKQYEQFGFAPQDPHSYSLCGVAGLRPEPCTEELVVEGLSNSHAIFPLHSKPAYSNIAFALLGYVVRNVTGLSFEDAMRKHLTAPMGMNRTTFSPISEGDMVIPPSPDALWSTDLGANNPGGGAYSTAHDMAILLRAILSSDSDLLPQATINEWLQPVTFGSEINSAVGFPWEITRTSKLSPIRIVDLYNKDGALPGYSSIFSLIPSSDIGFAIFVGDGDLVSMAPYVLAEALLASVFPAVDEATRLEVVDTGYTGNFSAGNSSIQLVMGEGGNGLLVEKWLSRGVDLLALSNSPGSNTTFRLYPSELVTVDGDTEEEVWRVLFETPGLPRPELESEGVFASDCASWGQPGRLLYNGQQADRLVVTKRNGTVESLEFPVLGVVMKKE